MKAERPKKRLRGRTSPSHTLEQAVGLIRKVDLQLGVGGGNSRETIAEALGHRSITGPANTKIGSLTHFGLLKKRPGGKYAVTEIAKKILRPNFDGEDAQAVAEAARSPSLYQELIARYNGERVPSLLPNILVRDYDVLPRNSTWVADTFRASMEFAGLLRDGLLYSEVPQSSNQGEVEPDSDAQNSDVGNLHPESNPVPLTGSTTTRSNISGVLDAVHSLQRSNDYAIPMSRGNIATLRLPCDINVQDLNRIRSWLDLMGEVLVQTELND